MLIVTNGGDKDFLGRRFFFFRIRVFEVLVGFREGVGVIRWFFDLGNVKCYFGKC